MAKNTPTPTTLQFNGLCLSCRPGKNTNYYKFVDRAGTEFQVNCKDLLQDEDIQRRANWTITNVRPVTGVNEETRKPYAYFAAEHISGEYEN